MLLCTLAHDLNLQVLVEGQGELGSPDLEALLKKHKALLSADAVLSTVGGPRADAPVAPADGPVDKTAAAVWEHVFESAPEFNRCGLGHALPLLRFGSGLDRRELRACMRLACLCCYYCNPFVLGGGLGYPRLAYYYGATDAGEAGMSCAYARIW